MIGVHPGALIGAEAGSHIGSRIGHGADVIGRHAANVATSRLPVLESPVKGLGERIGGRVGKVTGAIPGAIGGAVAGAGTGAAIGGLGGAGIGGYLGGSMMSGDNKDREKRNEYFKSTFNPGDSMTLPLTEYVERTKLSAFPYYSPALIPGAIGALTGGLTSDRHVLGAGLGALGGVAGGLAGSAAGASLGAAEGTMAGHRGAGIRAARMDEINKALETPSVQSRPRVVKALENELAQLHVAPAIGHLPVGEGAGFARGVGLGKDIGQAAGAVGGGYLGGQVAGIGAGHKKDDEQA
jgi:hypothetical protein